jgi:CheY-specific phosphatase CheX
MASEAAESIYAYTTQSFEEVINEITDIEIKQSDSFMLNSPSTLSVVVGSSGVINGRILLTTSYEDAKNVVTYMNFGDPVESEDEVFMYFAEFANMYCGRATTYMNNKFGARAMWISPPAIFQAEDLKIISPNIVTKKMYYQTEFGKFIVDIGIIDEEENDFGF